jgi:hypothetical protein
VFTNRLRWQTRIVKNTYAASSILFHTRIHRIHGYNLDRRPRTLTDSFFAWGMFKTKVVEKIKTHILCSITFFRKSCLLRDNVEKYGRTWQTTHYNIMLRMRFACWITKATDKHSEYVILLLFHGNNGYANAPQCYVYMRVYISCLVEAYYCWCESNLFLCNHTPFYPVCTYTGGITEGGTRSQNQH